MSSLGPRLFRSSGWITSSPLRGNPGSGDLIHPLLQTGLGPGLVCGYEVARFVFVKMPTCTARRKRSLVKEMSKLNDSLDESQF